MRKAWLPLAVILAAGCSGDQRVPVSGRITVNGEDLPEGTISFFPTGGKGATTGGPVEAGRYSVRVPPGSMKVVISAPKVVGKKKIYPKPGSPEMPITVERLPAKYNDTSELKLDVKPGMAEKDWALEAPPEKKGGK
jgi:hypothetical protein